MLKEKENNNANMFASIEWNFSSLHRSNVFLKKGTFRSLPALSTLTLQFYLNHFISIL